MVGAYDALCAQWNRGLLVVALVLGYIWLLIHHHPNWPASAIAHSD